MWCAGEWGTIYPMTGTSTAKEQNNVRAAANVAAKSIARSHQNLLLWPRSAGCIRFRSG